MKKKATKKRGTANLTVQLKPKVTVKLKPPILNQRIPGRYV